MQLTRDESGQVLRIAGSLGIETAKEFREALRDFVVQAPQPVVDLSAVETCDTAAMQLLYSARTTAELLQKRLELIGISAAVRDAGAALGLALTEALSDAI